MEIELKYIPFSASQWDVKRVIGGILHGDEFYDTSDPHARPINFDVELKDHKTIEARHDGTARLILPDAAVGHKLIRYTRVPGQQIRMDGRKLYLARTQKKPDMKTKERLEKTLYLNPEIEEELEEKLQKLNVVLHVEKLQFGVFYRKPGDHSSASRRFSVEHDVAYKDRSAGMLEFEYMRKLIRIVLGDRHTEEFAYNVVITFANIRKMAAGFDFGNPYVCFELHTPPVFQLQRFHRTLTGDTWKDERKYRMRKDSISGPHAAVAPYAHHMRIILHEPSDIDKFLFLCDIAEIKRPVKATIEASKQGFFTPATIWKFERMVKEFDWLVAFQLEALLRNGLLTTEEIMEQFYGPITQLCTSRPKTAAYTLRLFTEALLARDPNKESPKQCFDKLLTKPEPEHVDLPPGNFLCHHVTVTPSRMLLEGPFVIQSNRVIRQYRGYESHFIRVDFRDEDRLQYRWDSETDGTSLLEDRIGSYLKRGFVLAGRAFEFLAYSSSALREHAVWYINPFHHPERGFVTAEGIRRSLGDFTSVIKCPSKYAARLAQAFTATDPSVDIRRDQWEVMEDLGKEPYLFTDGVGTISKELGDMIWDALCAARDESYRYNNIQPSAYQIRFLGFKGMVVVDWRLTGVKMRLRKSMDKFQGPEEETATIEIARAFERPNTCYLNRPLVMILEDRGVEKETFIQLQDDAVAAINMSSDKVSFCRQLFRSHGLGNSFRMGYIWQFLAAIDMGTVYEKTRYVLEDPFFERLIQYAKNDVLRSIKHSARIPVPNSWLLVGVADEGAAYVEEGCENVFTLDQNQIYACVQTSPDEEPIYLKGPVILARSPVVHPGDVQRVEAIGKPPDDGRLCFFKDLKNVVVLPCAGPRSLASMLGGGDLDGDLYSIIGEDTLLPTEHADAAEYPPVDKYNLERDSTVEDICDFIIEYIDSDVLGLLSDRHLIIADQSRDGTRDQRCIELARLCSQAVDYPKNGVKVDIQGAPRRIIPFKPDWKQAEDNAPRSTDYYTSDRALGELYRNVHLIDTPKTVLSNRNLPAKLTDSISQALLPHIQRALGSTTNSPAALAAMEPVFEQYTDELRYICATHSLSDSPESRLVEEEVVVGTITAVCSQQRFRADRTYRMRLHSKTLVDGVRRKLYQPLKNPAAPDALGAMRYGLRQAWVAWELAMTRRSKLGANSFAVIALGCMAAALSDMNAINLKPEKRNDVTKEGEDEEDED